mmetsp:Transcript_29485/g.49579  ORF Transcript_29485/g.49579 Transcript_29485/m.49579 type:complete len:456 (-) Transcript_29485:50-1417(-)
MSYSFPILSNQEILACLSELDIQFTEQDLLKPTHESVKQVYEPLVQLLVGVTREELQQPALGAIDALEFPELHNESVATLAFSRALIDLTTAAGVHDFALADLYKPDPKTVRRTLSAIINFAKFREEKVCTYEELREASEAAAEKRTQLQQENAQLAATLQQLRDERAAEVPEVRQLEGEAVELEAAMEALVAAQAELQAEVKALKAKGNDLAEQAASSKMRLEETHQEEQLLRSQVVQSPERLQRVLADLTNQVDRDRAAATDAEKEGRELSQRLDALDRAAKDVTKCVKLVDEAAVEVKKHKEVLRQLKTAKQQIQANEEERWRVETEAQHFRRQEQVHRERIERLNQQGELKREAAVASVTAAREEKVAVELHNTATQARIAEVDYQIQALQRQVEDATASHNQEMSIVSTKYTQLQKQVQDYHRQVKAALAQAGFTPRPPMDLSTPLEPAA